MCGCFLFYPRAATEIAGQPFGWGSLMMMLLDQVTQLWVRKLQCTEGEKNKMVPLQAVRRTYAQPSVDFASQQHESH
jgi:hypothetical protein